jgi:1-acyl-sn-glycerol-3-phosphate acyltransferase
MALRGIWRLFVLLLAVLQGLALFLPVWLLAKGRPGRRQRAEWLHRSCVRILRRLSIDLEITGPLPGRGLVVSNHLSHLDILLFSAAKPCIFVSKVEIASWPFFGLAAKFGGTVFVNRENSASAAQAAKTVESLLSDDLPVILFAESTTTDGSGVLPFRSSFFEPAIRTKAPVSAAAVAYCAPIGHLEREVCFYGEDAFGPHLFKTLQLRSLGARIAVSPASKIYTDRKRAASESWQETIKLRESISAAQIKA